MATLLGSTFSKYSGLYNTMMSPVSRRRKVPPLKLDLVTMRKTLALLKQGKLFTPIKKAGRGR
jgi:hypothetical protein